MSYWTATSRATTNAVRRVEFLACTKIRLFSSDKKPNDPTVAQQVQQDINETLDTAVRQQLQAEMIEKEVKRMQAIKQKQDATAAAAAAAVQKGAAEAAAAAAAAANKEQPREDVASQTSKTERAEDKHAEKETAKPAEGVFPEGNLDQSTEDIFAALDKYEEKKRKRANYRKVPKSKTGRNVFLGILAVLVGGFMYIQEDEVRARKFGRLLAGTFLKRLHSNIQEPECLYSLNMLIGVLQANDLVVHDFLDLDPLPNIFTRCLPAKEGSDEDFELQMGFGALLGIMCEHESVRKRLLKDSYFLSQVMQTSTKLTGQAFAQVLHSLYKCIPEPLFYEQFLRIKGPELLYRAASRGSAEAQFFVFQFITWFCCAHPNYLRTNIKNINVNDFSTITNALMQMSSVFKDNDNYTAAIDCYKQLLIVAPANSYFITQIGVLRGLLGDKKGCAEALRKSLKLNPNQCEAAFMLAKMQLLEQGKTIAALQEARDVLAQGLEEVRMPPKNGSVPVPATAVNSAYKMLCEIEIALGEEEFALEEARDWSNFAPNNAKAHEFVGKLLTKRNKFSDALVSLDYAVMLNGSSVTALLYQAICFDKLQQPDAALQAVGRGVVAEKASSRQQKANRKVSKDAVQLYLFAGKLYSAHNQLPQAEEAYRSLVELLPQQPTGHFKLGTLLLKKGETTEAYKSLKAALDIWAARTGTADSSKSKSSFSKQDSNSVAFIGKLCSKATGAGESSAELQSLSKAYSQFVSQH